MSLAEIRRRFLVLRALRWLPTGLLIPIVVLLLLERGLIPGQIGLVIACQGLVVMLLELPTGGLGDTLGRRPVLMAAARFDLAGLSLLVVAETVPRPHGGVRLAGRLPGAGERAARVLVRRRRPGGRPRRRHRGCHGASGVVLGVALAVGMMVSSVLVAIAPVPSLDALMVPLLARQGSPSSSGSERRLPASPA